MFGDSVINGNVSYNGTQPAGTINGVKTTPLSLPLATAFPSLPSITPGTVDVSLIANEKRTVAAGNYRDAVILSGNAGQKTVLTLSGGLYQFRAISLGNDARIECASACEIRVKNQLASGNRSYLGPKSGVAGLGAGNVQLLVGGANIGFGPNGNPPAASFGPDFGLTAYVLVPNGTTVLGDRVIFRGKIVGRDVVIGMDNNAEGRQLALVTNNPASITVREGAPATFTVSATGVGISYQWQRNGVSIPGATSATYTKPTTIHATDDGAVYTVQLVNNAGTVVTAGATLTVIPCASQDLTCDDFDDDCDGQKDEDFVPYCTGASVVACVNHALTTTNCDDADVCNGTESCSQGACVAGTAIPIDDGNPCTADACNANGVVSHALLPSGTSCADNDPSDGNEVCDENGFCELPECAGTGTCEPELGPIFDTPNAAPPTQCLPGDTGLVLVPSLDPERAQGLAVRTPGPNCPSPLLSPTDTCDEFSSIEAINAELATQTPAADIEPCQPLGPGGINECAIDRSTLRAVNCQGNDNLCAPGEECIQYCTDNTCRTVDYGCAQREECGEPGLKTAGLYCLPDVWDCSEPVDTSEISAVSVYQQVNRVDNESQLLVVDPSPEALVPPTYVTVEQAGVCYNRNPLQGSDVVGRLYEDPLDNDVFQRPQDQTLGSPIILGGDKFALFAQPTFFQDYKLNVESLDHFDVGARAQGALVGGVKLFGRSVTVVDVDAHAFITQCGVDASARLNFLGQTVAGLPSVVTQSNLCNDLFNDLSELIGPVREGLVLARKLRKLLESPDEDAVCEFMEDLWEATNWKCDSLAELDADPTQWKHILVSAAVNHYRDSLANYSTVRADYISQAVATEVGSGDAADSEFDLIPPTEFVGTSIQQAIPLGPLSVVVAASLSGNYGLKGGLDYELKTGFESGVVSGSPKLSAGAKVTPNLGVHSALYVGVGIGIGSIASASIGVEGQLTIIEVGVPISTKVELGGSSFTDLQLAGQGVLRSVDGTGWEADPGEPATGVPSDRVYTWNLDWQFGGRLNLTTLSGQLAAAARVQFLWFSKTFRKKIAEFAGPAFSIPLAEASVDIGGGFPIPQMAALDPYESLENAVGWAGERIGFNAMKQHWVEVSDGNTTQQRGYQFSPDGSADLCVPYNPGPR